MILKQKFKFVTLAGLLFWLVILVKYLSRSPSYFQDVKWTQTESSDVADEVRVTDDEEVKPPTVSWSMPVKPPVGSLNPQEDEDLSEVLFKEETAESTKSAYDKPGSADPYSGPENSQQEEIVMAFRHAWSAYRKHAWGSDELRPLSKSGSDWMRVGLTIIDSLDSLYIMGLKEEFYAARDWVSRQLTSTHAVSVQFFEIVIRLLGGLLSAFHLSKDAVFLQKAVEFGEVFKNCFGGPHGLPCHRINLNSKVPIHDDTNLAEVGTIQLEFRDLSRASGDAQYETSAMKVSEHLHSLKKIDGLLQCFFTSQSSEPAPGSIINFGARSDSYYEYLLKQWLQTGKSIKWLREDYENAIQGARKLLMRKSTPNKFYYIGSLIPAAQDGFEAVMEHLTCFLPGTLALGHMNGLPASHLQLALELTRTCYSMYERMPLGLSPESVNFGWSPDGTRDFSVEASSRHNIHRPETVESLFYMYRATKDPMYRTWGWNIFKAFQNYTMLDEGYAGVQNVEVKSKGEITYIDKMETFYLAETLKYLYLLFSDRDDLLPLDRWVFNTEAHPLPIYDH